MILHEPHSPVSGEYGGGSLSEAAVAGPHSMRGAA